MRKPAIIVAISVALYAAFFWIFGDDFSPRVMFLAGIFWGAIVLAILVALYYPVKHNGNNHNGNGNHNGEVK